MTNEINGIKFNGYVLCKGLNISNISMFNKLNYTFTEKDTL